MLGSPLLFLGFRFLLAAFAQPLQDEAPASLVPTIRDSASFNLSAGRSVLIACDDSITFTSSIVDDCRPAKSYLKHGVTTYTWRYRETGSVTNFVNLPYRSMGSSLLYSSISKSYPQLSNTTFNVGLTFGIDQGLCYFQPVLMPGATRAKSNLDDVQIAATALFTKCALGQSSGGRASFVGADKNLAIVLSAYESRIECRGNIESLGSCANLVGGMPASPEEHDFGPAPAEIPVPYTLASADDKCQARLFTTGPSDRTSWYHVWEAATAIWATCVRHGKSGLIRNLGNEHKLFLSMTATPQVASE